MLAKPIRLLRWTRHGRDRGNVAVEFAIAAPVLIMLALGLADYGSLMNTTASLRGATRAGAEYVKATWNDPAVTDPTGGAEQQVCGFLGFTLSGSSCPPVTSLSVSPACTCADDTTVACPSTGGSNPCSANSDPRVLISVTVAATQTFQPIVPWGSFAFPTTLTASAVVRTQ